MQELVFVSLLILFSEFPVSGAVCPDNWIQHSDSCYLFETRYSLDWIKALSYCHTLGATLAEVGSSSENSFLKQESKRLHGNFWLGGNDIVVEGEWIWASTHKPLTFTGWHQGQPNNHHGNEHCLVLELSINEDWDDVPCSSRISFICEKPASVVLTVIG